ncbi:MAG: alkaline phosphatase D family protein [Gammaproteobacteria bacterium]
MAANRPLTNKGCASGDVTDTGAVLWTRADRPAQMQVTLSEDPDFNNSRRYSGGFGIAENDFNTKTVVDGLRPDSQYFYRIECESLESPGLLGEPIFGSFRSASVSADNAIRFCWSGDTAGQGWGIDRGRGGMTIYQAMLSQEPDFFVHSGDQIYADGPINETVTLDDGTLWRNELIEAKTRVAQSTQDFRENYYYNYLDDHLRRFHAEVPVYYQWDDHEVVNNWYPGEILDDDRYSVKSASLLAARSRRAMFDCNPIANNQHQPERIYRKISYGPLLELFFLDLRSYRGPNSRNRQPQKSAETAFMGDRQLQWLKQSLADSTATWKIICSDMPIGLIVPDGGSGVVENGANADGPPLGRELEIADLLGFVHRQEIANVHFITADVHYCASHYYSPEKAVFKDFTPFWEFVSGPLHAGTFGPSQMDNTFGPEEIFRGIPEGMTPNRPPSEGFQFYGLVDIDPDDQSMTITHLNAGNDVLWKKTLHPEG